MIFKSLKEALTMSKDERSYKRSREFDSNINANFAIYPISISDSAYLCSLGAKTCYNLNVADTYKKNIEHIKRIMGYGHDSISAHSNIMFLLTISAPKDSNTDNLNMISIINALPGMRFMNISVLPFVQTDSSNYNKDSVVLLISGSIRAFRYFVMKESDLIIDSYSNIDREFIDSIYTLIYSSIEKEFFTDMLKDNEYNYFLKENEFKYIPELKLTTVEDKDGNEIAVTDENSAATYHQDVYGSKHVTLYYRDKLEESIDSILNIIQDGYSKDAIYKALVKSGIVTIKLHNYSRAISQQINRHLSGISQESQRYVDYSNTEFIDPLPFNPKVYPDSNKKYKIKFGDNNSIEVTSAELGKLIIDIYPQLKEQGMVNQEARSFLPMNSETKAVHTFTYENLFHFLKVRDNDRAQPEVQQIAKEIKQLLKESIDNSNPTSSDGKNMLDYMRTFIE